jgi:hypothetical protein
MNMVDVAFERVDVAHSHSNNEIVLWHLLGFENKHKKGPVFEEKVFWKKTLVDSALNRVYFRKVESPFTLPRLWNFHFSYLSEYKYHTIQAHLFFKTK